MPDLLILEVIMVNVIFFKILVLSYKTLNGLVPKDLSNLIT